VERRLGRVPGVTAYVVEVETDRATVTYDPAETTQERIVKAIADAGYQARQVVEVK
jgi:copper chaperone CopZ